MPFYNIKHIISKKPKLGLIFPKLNMVPPYPLFLLTHITLACDRQCNWCYQMSDKFYSLHNMNMEISLFEKILANFIFFKPHMHIYGGEPLLHPDFPLFLKYCQIYGYKPTLTTNGDHLDRYSEVIRKSSLSQLNISLNGFIDSNGAICSNLERKLREFINTNKNGKKINLNYVVEPNNYKYLEDIVLHFNRNYRKGDFSYFAIQHFANQHWMTNEARDMGFEGTFNIRKLLDILNRLKKTNLKFRLIFLPDIKTSDLENYYDSDYTFKNKCYVPWFGLSIYPDLTITPGGGVLGCNFVLGNLSQASIMEIWKSAQLNNFRMTLIREDLPKICNRCCHKLYY